MRGFKVIKRGLLVGLCLMLVAPVGGPLAEFQMKIPGSMLRVEATDASSSDAAHTVGANSQYHKDTKQLIKDYYELNKQKIKDAGNESAAKEYLDRMVGDITKPDVISGILGAQRTQEGINALKDDVLAALDGFKSSNDAPVDTTPRSSNSNIMVGGNWVTPVANAGSHVNVVLPVVNMGKDMVRDAVVTPVIASDSKEWPFEIEKSSYTQTIADLPGTRNGGSDMDRRRELTWTFKTRKDAPSGYMKLTFNVTFQNSDGTEDTATLETYVNVVGTTGVSADGSSSTPRVIVTGFSTSPEVVHAGETFVLTLHMQNTSQATAVKNMLFDIQAASESTDTTYVAASFLPTSGSSTIFVDRIPAGGSKDISMEMEARSDLAPRPYVVNVSMDYEDEHVNAYKNTANVSIPVRQEARVEISSIEVMPDTIEVGSEANVMFSIYNTGKTQLYNTNVKLEAESISGGESFLGNIAPGATGNVDMYVSGQMATMDDGIVKILITFEDEAGEVTTIEKEMTLFVSEPYFDDSMMGGEDFGMMEEPKKGLPIWAIILIILLVTGIIVAVVVIIRKRKKKKAETAEAALLDQELLEEGSVEESADEDFTDED